MPNNSTFARILSGFFAALTFTLVFSLIQLFPELVPPVQSRPAFMSAAKPSPHFVTVMLLNGNALSGKLLARNPRTGTVVIGWKGGAVSFDENEIREMKFHTDDYRAPGDGLYIRHLSNEEDWTPVLFKAGSRGQNALENSLSQVSLKLQSLGAKLRHWGDLMAEYRNILNKHGF